MTKLYKHKKLHKRSAELLTHGIHGLIPQKISTYASLAPEAYDSPDWFYEVKWDGYRTIAYAENETFPCLHAILHHSQKILSS